MGHVIKVKKHLLLEPEAYNPDRVYMLLLEQNTEVTEEDISIVKLNISNFHKLN